MSCKCIDLGIMIWKESGQVPLIAIIALLSERLSVESLCVSWRMIVES